MILGDDELFRANNMSFNAFDSKILSQTIFVVFLRKRQNVLKYKHLKKKLLTRVI